MTALMLTALLAADVARCESGDRLDDAAAVLAVARGRALDSGRKRRLASSMPCVVDGGPPDDPD